MVTGTFARWIAVTAAATPLPGGPCDSLYVGAAGTVTVTLQDGTSCAIPAVAGAILPVKAYAVTSLGAATSVFALYR